MTGNAATRRPRHLINRLTDRTFGEDWQLVTFGVSRDEWGEPGINRSGAMTFRAGRMDGWGGAQDSLGASKDGFRVHGQVGLQTTDPVAMEAIRTGHHERPMLRRLSRPDEWFRLMSDTTIRGRMTIALTKVDGVDSRIADVLPS